MLKVDNKQASLQWNLHLAYTRSGRYLIAGLQQQTGFSIRIWNAFTGELIKEVITKKSKLLKAFIYNEVFDVIVAGGSDEALKFYKLV